MASGVFSPSRFRMDTSGTAASPLKSPHLSRTNGNRSRSKSPPLGTRTTGAAVPRPARGHPGRMGLIPSTIPVIPSTGSTVIWLGWRGRSACRPAGRRAIGCSFISRAWRATVRSGSMNARLAFILTNTCRLTSTSPMRFAATGPTRCASGCAACASSTNAMTAMTR